MKNRIYNKNQTHPKIKTTFNKKNYNKMQESKNKFLIKID